MSVEATTFALSSSVTKGTVACAAGPKRSAPRGSSSAKVRLNASSTRAPGASVWAMCSAADTGGGDAIPVVWLMKSGRSGLTQVSSGFPARCGAASRRASSTSGQDTVRNATSPESAASPAASARRAGFSGSRE
jgi:hypothetical protein